MVFYSAEKRWLGTRACLAIDGAGLVDWPPDWAHTSLVHVFVHPPALFERLAYCLQLLVPSVALGCLMRQLLKRIRVSFKLADATKPLPATSWLAAASCCDSRRKLITPSVVGHDCLNLKLRALASG